MKLTKRQLKRIIREEYARLQSQGILKEMYDDYDGYGEPPEIFTLLSNAIRKVMNKQGGMWIQKKRNPLRSLKNAVNTISMKQRFQGDEYYSIRDSAEYDAALQEIIDGLVMSDSEIKSIVIDYVLS